MYLSVCLFLFFVRALTRSTHMVFCIEHYYNNYFTLKNMKIEDTCSNKKCGSLFEVIFNLSMTINIFFIKHVQMYK